MGGAIMASTRKQNVVAEIKPGKGQQSISAFFATVPKKEVAKRPAREIQQTPRKRQKAAEAGLQLTSAGSPAQEEARSVSPPLAARAPAKLHVSDGKRAAEQVQQTQPQGKDPVGERVTVYWPLEHKWFNGRITAKNAAGKHHIAYDDGDEDWVKLAEEKWKLLEGEPQKEKRKRSLIRKSAQIVLSSPSSDSPGDEEESDFEASEDSEEDDIEDLVDSEGEEEAPPVKKSRPQAKKSTTSKPGGRTPASGKGDGRVLPAAAENRGASRNADAGTAQKGALTAALTPKAPSGDANAAVEPSSSNNLASYDWERYSLRAAEKFPFLHPDKIKDANGKRPGEPGYNPRTLRIPPAWFKDAKISEGRRQWWEFKAQHFDSVLLFKMGKFYEMFEMDAHTGAEVLGLIYMKGEQPHCGFPEANYHRHAERLARAGLRVVVIEQIETPDQLRLRNEQRKAAGKPKVGVVNRKMVNVLTLGTLTDPEMLLSHSDASYVYALAELPAVAGGSQPRLGACAVECALGQMLVGSWTDDGLRTNLRSQLAALRPVEVVIPSKGLSAQTRKVLQASLRKPRLNQLQPDTEFWSADRTIDEVSRANYFEGSLEYGSWPQTLQQAALNLRVDGASHVGSALQDLKNEGAAGEAGLCALGGAISFLRSVLLDKSVVGLGRIDRMTPASRSSAGEDTEPATQGPRFVALDGSALENLEVLETTSGSTPGSLLSTLDACATPAGRRKLKDWLCCPLGRVPDIQARQDAVHTLMTDAADAASDARRLFCGVGDLERAIARLCASSLGSFGRDDGAVVLYEDAAKRKVAAFVAALKGLQKLQEAFQGFQELGDHYLASSMLCNLTTPGSPVLPDFGPPLQELLEAADWEAAEAQGRIAPKQGVDKAFDDAVDGVVALEEQLKEHLQDVRKILKGKSSISYVSLNKDSHVLEVPEELVKGVPGDFELVSQKKGFKRYITPKIRQLVKELAEAIQKKEVAMAGILQGMVNRFAQEQQAWNGVITAMAELDALMSLAAAAEQASAYGPVCRPNFLPPTPDDPQVFQATALRHPAASARGGDFVPNDVDLGRGGNFIVLTGPNMGGKSTLLRQVCLAALLAHVGAWVPAESLELTPVDAIFVRTGARDSIISGQSTFFVELTETASALNRATSRSLVALDELGRGTSTSDGAAIASAALQHLSSAIRCRGLFATHYHKLADAYANDPSVAIRHMSCCVQPTDDGTEQVIFLYKLAAGACPKSYGTNVAQLAGIPKSVVGRAAEFAAKLEARSEKKGGDASAGLAPTEASKLQKVGSLLRADGVGAAETLAALQALQNLN